MKSELAGNPFRCLADTAMQSIQLHRGWPILIVGVALLITSVVMKEETMQAMLLRADQTRVDRREIEQGTRNGTSVPKWSSWMLSFVGTAAGI
ncbi:MAG: hypothetical protein ABSF52_12875 [Syntrophobacteraceae bacterium]